MAIVWPWEKKLVLGDDEANATEGRQIFM